VALLEDKRLLESQEELKIAMEHHIAATVHNSQLFEDFLAQATPTNPLRNSLPTTLNYSAYHNSLICLFIIFYIADNLFDFTRTIVGVFLRGYFEVALVLRNITKEDNHDAAVGNFDPHHDDKQALEEVGNAVDFQDAHLHLLSQSCVVVDFDGMVANIIMDSSDTDLVLDNSLVAEDIAALSCNPDHLMDKTVLSDDEEVQTDGL